jgi:ABC-2 type transport system permease protein
MVQPVIFLVLFGSLLSGVAWSGDDTAWQWFVPGILIMMGLSITVSAGYMLLTEITGGSLDRMLVTPVTRVAILVGRTMKDVVMLLAQSLLIIVVVLPFGFHPHVAGTVSALFLLTVIGIGLGAYSCALAVAARKQVSLIYVIQQTLLFLLPMESAPAWLRAISRANPLTYIVDAERALFAGRLTGVSVLVGTLCAVAFAVSGVLVGVRAMRYTALWTSANSANTSRWSEPGSVCSLVFVAASPLPCSTWSSWTTGSASAGQVGAHPCPSSAWASTRPAASRSRIGEWSSVALKSPNTATFGCATLWSAFRSWVHSPASPAG